MQGVRKKWVVRVNHSNEQLQWWERLPCSKVGRSEDEEFQQKMFKDSVLDCFYQWLRAIRMEVFEVRISNLDQGVYLGVPGTQMGV